MLGEYLPTALNMEPDEKVMWACVPGDYAGDLIFFFENGKAARVALSAYKTQSRRRKLTAAYSDKSSLVSILYLNGDQELVVSSNSGKTIAFDSAILQSKSSRTAQGVAVLSLKSKDTLVKASFLTDTKIKRFARYRVKSLPATGVNLIGVDKG